MVTLLVAGEILVRVWDGLETTRYLVESEDSNTPVNDVKWKHFGSRFDTAQVHLRGRLWKQVNELLLVMGNLPVVMGNPGYFGSSLTVG